MLTWKYKDKKVVTTFDEYQQMLRDNIVMLQDELSHKLYRYQQRAEKHRQVINRILSELDKVVSRYNTDIHKLRYKLKLGEVAYKTDKKKEISRRKQHSRW